MMEFGLLIALFLGCALLVVGLVLLKISGKVHFAGMSSFVMGVSVLLITLLISLVFTESKENRLEDAYDAYYAYEDGVISVDEEITFESYGSIVDEDVRLILDEMPLQGMDLAKKVDRVQLSDTLMSEYNGLVNRVIELADSSENKLAFKQYVLEKRQDDLLKIWYDEKLDDTEKELLGFAGEVSGISTEGIVNDLSAGDVDAGLSGLDKVFKALDDVSNKFDLVSSFSS